MIAGPTGAAGQLAVPVVDVTVPERVAVPARPDCIKVSAL